MEVVFGYTCANDVTARDQQRTDGQWSRAKGYDTFCPLGPWIETDLDPSDLRITTTLERRDQAGLAGPRCIVHKIPALIAYITACMTLAAGRRDPDRYAGRASARCWSVTRSASRSRASAG